MVRTADISREARRGFTLVEILFSVLLLGILMGLLFVAFGSTRKYASAVAARDAVSVVKMGVSRFTDEFGFPPPMIKDWVQGQPKTVIVGPDGTVRFAVFNFASGGVNETSNAADLLLLRASAATAANPFNDRRYSDRTLAVYLAGFCDVIAAPSASDARAREVPIDGVRGPGFYKPRRDGTFEVPMDVKLGSAATTSRSGGAKFEPLIDVSKKSLKLYSVGRDPSQLPANDPNDGDSAADPTRERFVEVRDARNVAIRYYRWVNGAEYTTGGRTTWEVRTIDDLRVPALVGRKGTAFPGTPADRDIELSPALREATWAIVAAGPDGAFGDENLNRLSARLGFLVTADNERKARLDAERDNVVEVGK